MWTCQACIFILSCMHALWMGWMEGRTPALIMRNRHTCKTIRNKPAALKPKTPEPWTLTPSKLQSEGVIYPGSFLGMWMGFATALYRLLCLLMMSS